MLTPEQENAIRSVMELCEAVPYNTDKVYRTSTLNEDGEHITHVDREQWLEMMFESVYDQLGQAFDISTF